ncbi:NmrA family transcriptional regulator [Leptospira kanakyensis]|uniref:NmrA family transcriptional regulator n=1 Tax=Leptospira kanakyensis TaxID=2484968 RepID=A0A6N4PVY2_9LEPT|nr:NAD(P)H-binding protein [Leptospira kanakyensis]TGK49242.1 NmrA family transcriptional regulator [Leptospira kanakyensis]TGK60516.1 NmrA family transcriptional regulator [Leptospira kanakyensis]TGK67916.1 NmrA family transcriptional regulator [Leptospira kanakyensis]
MKPKTLIIGSSGKTGSRILSKLKTAGYPVRLGSRKETPAFDWEKPELWETVIQGVDQVYISFQPDLAVPSSLSAIQTLVGVCQTNQVNRLVLLSGRGEPEAETCEQIVQNSGLEWTILRSSWFLQNFSEGMFLDQILEGRILLPKLTVKEPFVDLDDLADLAFESLVTDKHRNKVYELTGPELLSFQDVILKIAETTNQSIPIEELPLDDYITTLKGFGLPEDALWLIDYLFRTVLDGRNESVVKDLELALGRKPKDFNTYVKETAKSGIWKISQPII